MVIDIKLKDILWNYLGICVSLGSQVILLPLLVHFLNPDDLGMWYIFVSIGAIVSLFDFGFNPTIARTVAYSWSGTDKLNKIGVKRIKYSSTESNYELLYFIIKTCKILYFMIALIAFILMISVGSWYIYSINDRFIIDNIYIPWIIYSCAIFFNLYIGYYSVALRGIGMIFLQSKANIISKLLFLLIAGFGLTFGYGLLSLSIAFFISGFVLRSLSAYFFYNKCKIKNQFNKLIYTRRYKVSYVFKNMWYNSWRDGVVSLTMYLTTQLTTLLCASFLSLSETGIYSFCLQVITAILTISVGMYSTSQPSLQSAYINNDKNLSLKLFSISIFLYYFIAILGTIIFLLIGIPFIYYIKQSFYIDKAMYILLTINIFLMNRHRISASFISNMNKLPYVKSFFLSAICYVICSYIFMKEFNLGVYGMIWASIIIQSLYNNWKWNIVVNKYLNINEFRLLIYGYKEVMAKIKWRMHRL